MTGLLASFSGFGTGLALIIAIGAQNAHLLRLAIGARMRVIAAAVLICALSDAVLIVAGAVGVGALVERVPVALVVVRFIGAAFLLTYGVLAARRALQPTGGSLRLDLPVPADTRERRTAATSAAMSAAQRDDADRSATPDRSATGTATRAPVRPIGPTTRRAVFTMLAFTWANPHVYLDTLVFLGSVANQQGPTLRWWWVAGAVVASCVWFAGVGFGGRALRPVFARPRAWQVFDAGIAVVMLGFGLKLLLGA